MMGEGDLPIPQMLDALVDIGYDGYISLEWVKRWAQELSDAGVVFPQFANYMHDYFATLSMKEGELQDNHSHTGKYVWPKETLIDAKAHPENYPTLMVRVAGYSVYWTDIAERVQDDIINRTEHTF